MLRKFSVVAIALLFLGATANKSTKPQWSMNATLIEACSCPMFCQCYFNGEPGVHAGHTGLHKGHQEGQYCRFNIAGKVNRGSYKGTDLTGAKYWIAGDLGANFGMGQTEWAVVTFDPSVTKEQREGIATVLGKVYPVKWGSFNVAEDAPISWKATKDLAVATLDDAKAAEIALGRFQGMTSDPVVIKNLRYFGAPRNAGFIMMPNTVEAYRLGDKAFEFKGTNGFMITFDITSAD
jgi:hypothetical protein